MVNPLDRLIGFFSPRAGYERHVARTLLTRAYEAASPRDSWKPRRAGASANADHAMDARIIRNKARALVQNVGYMRAALEDGLVAYTIGTGIMPRATGQGASKLNNLLEQWSHVCDADRRFDLYGMQAAAYRAMELDGEVLIRLRARRPQDGLPVPLQLQLLEIDWLDGTKNGSQGGNQIINGIEYGALGTVVAYWLLDQHPGDTGLLRSLRTTSTRVPAASIIHLYNPSRPGQGRGFSRFAPVIARVRDLQLYEDAELARKNLEARLSVLATGDVASMENPAGFGAAAEGGARQTGELGELSSGGIVQLPSGVNLTVVEPKPAAGYVDSVKKDLKLISAGIGVPYEIVTGDMSEVNFSSARVRMLTFRTAVQQLQWTVLVPRLLRPIHKAFVDAAELAGLIGTADYAVDFSTPKWDYVNPQQEVKADLDEIGGGLATVSEKLRQRGYDPDVVFQERAKEIKQFKELGIYDVMLFLMRGNLPTSPPPEPKKKGDGKDADEDDVEA